MYKTFLLASFVAMLSAFCMAEAKTASSSMETCKEASAPAETCKTASSSMETCKEASAPAETC